MTLRKQESISIELPTEESVTRFISAVEQFPMHPTLQPFSQAGGADCKEHFRSIFKQLNPDTPIPKDAALITSIQTAYDECRANVVDVVQSIVLAKSVPQTEFTQFDPIFRVEHSRTNSHLSIDYILPLVALVPNLSTFQNGSLNADFLGILSNSRSKPQRPPKIPKEMEHGRLYRAVIASVCFQVLRSVFKADTNCIRTISLNGYAPLRPKDKLTAVCLVALRVKKEQIMKSNILDGNRWKTLGSLGAVLSDCPERLLEIEPLKEFKNKDSLGLFAASDKEVLTTGDAVTSSEELNLGSLSPIEFEQLIARFFEKLGLSVKLTSISHDGGIDCDVMDPRPVIGGRIIVQAKHYEGAIGVSAVRDLYGTLQHEGANKAILITTGTISAGCYKFAAGKPIELLDKAKFIDALRSVGVKAI